MFSSPQWEVGRRLGHQTYFLQLVLQVRTTYKERRENHAPHLLHDSKHLQLNSEAATSSSLLHANTAKSHKLL